MNVRQTVSRQYARIVDEAMERAGGLNKPPEGWLATVRKALGMSARQVGERAGVTKAAVYQAERKELAGGVTLRQLEKLAAALDARLVYALVPAEGSVGAQLERRAREKAERVIRRASSHMALERQGLPEKRVGEQVKDLALEFAREAKPELWDD
ncbi:MAG: mobile mystery protein A [Gammaproteobacteria bacterium]|nr:mobile mystery protein A [Gammaproteobacteria bacterium]MXZ27370.1 mobile mystery protein A [Gammaproteobacteria bacterium]MYF58999.1 mobile mystery protein A [Gammaproteobacteria bacterium]